MATRQIRPGEPDPGSRHVEFFLVGLDGVTPAENEEGGQPEISINEGSFTTSGVGPLVKIAGTPNSYYAVLTQASVLAAGWVGESRYESATAALVPGDSWFVIAAAPTLDEVTASVLEALSAGAAGALAASAAGPLRAKTDAGEMEQHNLKDQIAADKYLAAKASAGDPRKALRLTRMSRRDPT